MHLRKIGQTIRTINIAPKLKKASGVITQSFLYCIHKEIISFEAVLIFLPFSLDAHFFFEDFRKAELLL
jgi:hypothetical protein